ncbi:ATP-dependent helicase HrpB [Teredinibacter turnerae]|uniref:ATP-dependent helicase HrpB n=1 Tax=Teredinibacter turnerae TaxID=2426 RepID=UPI0030CE7A4B
MTTVKTSSARLPQLPIATLLDELALTLQHHHQLVLEAPPGAGKTTLVPLALRTAEWLRGRKIVMLEPRRVAAKAAAVRMAELLEEPVGKTIGYTMRLEQKCSRDTIIEVVTEGILTRRLQQDPSLDDTALVIFDEFHERSMHSDLGLALCMQSRELLRDDTDPLKLLVMSATLDAQAIADLLGGAPKLTSAGRSFPVKVTYAQHTPNRADLVSILATTVVQALNKHSGDCLVFLPGQREIHQLKAALSESLSNEVAVMPLFGSLSLAEQQKAISPLTTDPIKTRKVVLATDIAETSLTIDGVHIVVDSGLARKPKFDPRTGMTRLHTGPISIASSTQRAGRAGRLAPGNCYRCWTETAQHQRAAQATPEILQSDLAPLAMQLLQWGVNDPQQLQWLDEPPKPAFQQACDLLFRLKAIDTPAACALNEHGQAMAMLPLHPRLAHLLLVATEFGRLPLAASVAAILSEAIPDIGQHTDLMFVVETVEGRRSLPSQHRAWLQRIRQQRGLLLSLLSHNREANSTDEDLNALGLLIASAYPDRIARKRTQSRNRYLLANGRAAQLSPNDSLAGTEWLAIADIGGVTNQSEDRIFAAASLTKEDLNSGLAAQKTQERVIEWRENRVLAQDQVRIGAILVEQRAASNVTAEDRTAATLNYIRLQGLGVLPWNSDINQWRARVALVRENDNSSALWPDLSDEALMETIDNWLAPYLIDIDNLQSLKRLDLASIVHAQLPWSQQQLLEQLAPTRIKVPSGNHISINYLQSPPQLEVKLQEMFGCEETPSIINGKVALLIHLLSPARRPLQITQDLAGFWRNGYEAVKKEMKGRYPKHPWPDDPLSAQATQLTKRRLSADAKK